MTSKVLTIGRIVHYVLEDHIPGEPSQYHERPAIVVAVGEDEKVDLQIFLNGDRVPASNMYTPPSILWRVGVEHNEIQLDDTWHWPDNPGPTVKHILLTPTEDKENDIWVP